jgi:hypothetical protein
MNDDEIRTLVREAIQKHLGPSALAATSPARSPAGVVETGSPGTVQSVSFSRYRVQRVSDDGMCLIEPAVRCNHCGYCECHGH